jgi:hypothetical protein
VGAGSPFDTEDKLTTTLMKKLFSLAAIVALAFVAIGCEPKEAEVPPAGAATNAVPPAAK